MTEKELLGFRLLAGERLAILDYLWERCRSRLPTHVLTLNPEMVMLAEASAESKSLLLQADICVADGVGIEWAARQFRLTGLQRYAGVDLARDLLERLAQHGGAVFLLGSTPGVAEEAGRRLAASLPGLRVAGARDGYFQPQDEAALVEQIAASGSSVLLAGMGCPRQEEFISRNRSGLNTPLMIGVGGALEVFAGRKRRAPEWVVRMRLEWLWRSLLDISRIRRLAVLPRFVRHVMAEARRGRSRQAA